MNLPTEVTFATGKINYTYDAAGTRLVKKVQPSGGTMVTTDYVNDFQYENNVLQFFSHAEGYVKADGNSYLYAYQYKDHLGNVRLSYADVDGNGTIDPATEILEENNYYPFGLLHKGYNEIANSNRSEAAEKYKFNGMEWQPELGLNAYDFGARNYDPALGRWMNLDPLAEVSRRWTPYNYAYNNPIYFIDPDGMQAGGWGFDSYGRDLVNIGAIASWNMTSGEAYWSQFIDEDFVDPKNDCDSCKTQADWDAYHQQAYNTASMLGVLQTVEVDGEKFNFIKPNDWLQESFNEDGTFDAYYLHGERMDLRQYSNRAHAAGAMLGDAALIEGGTRFLKYLSSFFKSGGDDVVIKSGSLFNENVYDSFVKHAFARNRHADLGLSIDNMASKGMNLIEKNKGFLKEGDNTLIGTVNGIQKSFKAFVKNGKVMSVNMYSGTSNRVTNGTIINYGNKKWK